MARQLTWRDLSVEQVEEYLAMADGPARLAFLESATELPEDGEQRAIVLDLYHYTLQFAQRQRFTGDKASALFSIVKDTHEQSMRGFWPARRSFEFFKKLLLEHSVQRPPYSVGLFSLADVKAITGFASAGYFRHYMLYKYAFTPKTEMAFSTVFQHTLTVPEGFLQPLASGEDEDKKLAREEAEALAKLSTGVVQVTSEEMAAAGVPEDIREKLMAEVNAALSQTHAAIEDRFNSEHAALQQRVQSLNEQLTGSPVKAPAPAAPKAAQPAAAS